MLSTIISLSITTFPWIIPASLQIFNFKVEYICSLYWGEGGRGEKRKKERGREGRKFIKRKKREKKNLSLDSAVPSEQTMIFISLKSLYYLTSVHWNMPQRLPNFLGLVVWFLFPPLKLIKGHNSNYPIHCLSRSLPCQNSLITIPHYRSSSPKEFLVFFLALKKKI